MNSQLTNKEIQAIIENVEVEISIGNIKLYQPKGEDFLVSNNFFDDDFKHNLTELQKLMYKNFSLRLYYENEEHEIWCRLQARFEYRNGGKNAADICTFIVIKP